MFVAIAVGVGYWWTLNRTRFGFDLRASGLSSTAATASGIDAKRMVLYVMLLSGAVAGLIGLPQLLGESHAYNLDFPAGLGFTGIAIALLGRNSPIGIVFGALLWAFLDVSRQILDLEGVSKEIVTIMRASPCCPSSSPTRSSAGTASASSSARSGDSSAPTRPR